MKTLVNKMQKIKIIRAPTKEDLFEKVRQEKGEVERMGFYKIGGEFRMTVVFR